MRNRMESPVVWGVAAGVGLAQIQQLSTKINVNGWDIGIAILTIAVAVFGAINNPTNPDGL